MSKTSMKDRSFTKTPESIYVTRTVKLPLSASELEARKSELPLVISQEARLALHRKSVMAGLKDEAEELAEKRDKLVREINSEERVEDLRCLKVPVLFENSWQIIHPTTGEVMERIPMTFGEIERLTKEHADRVGDGQMTLPEEENIPASGEEDAADSDDENLSTESDEGGSFRLLSLPEPSPAPPVGEDLPRLIAAPDVEIIEGEIVEAEVLTAWETALSPLAIMAPVAGYWRKPATFSMPEESVRKAMDNNISSKISLSKFTGTWLPKKATEWNGCLWVTTSGLSGPEGISAELWRVIPVEDPHAQTVLEALPATDRRGYHGVLLGIEDKRGNLVTPQFMMVGPPVEWSYDKITKAEVERTATYLLMGDRQREKELADQTLSQVRKQARAEAHEARVAESLRRAEEREVSASADPALSLDITPARSATDQASDFAAQLVGGGA